MKYFQQSTEWEALFKRVIKKAKDCPAAHLCLDKSITAEVVANAAGNHLFDDYFEFWGITHKEGHAIRGVFQSNSTDDPEFKEYIQNLIDTCQNRY